MQLNYRKIALKTSSKSGGPSTWDDESRSVEVTAASENPSQVYDYERGLVNEILLMSGCEVPDNRQVPLLDVHSRYSASSVLGSCRNLAISGQQLIGRAHFSGAGSVDETALKVKEGHITDFSAGYRVLESEWVPAGQKTTIKGRIFEGPVLVSTRWRIKELSVVPIGADEFSKARSQFQIIKEKNIMENFDVNENNVRPRTTRRETERLVREEIQDIIALGDTHGMQREAADAIQEGWSKDQFRQFVLDKMTSRGNSPLNAGSADLGLSRREVKQFSFLNVIRALSDPNNARTREQAAFEFECSRAIEDATRRSAKGCFVPNDVLRHDMTTRGMAVNSFATGGALVAENMLAGSFIDSLENAMVVKALGATIIRDLVGDVAIPKKTGGATAYWVGEGDDITESQPTLGQVALRPKTVGDYTELTRKFILQSSIDAELFTRNELALRLALAIDLAALAGLGTAAQPQGILNTTGIGAKTLTTANAPTHGELCDIWSEIAVDNALVGSLGYCANATIAGKMMQTEAATNTGKWLLENGRTSNGYPFLMSNQVTEKYILFGNWRDLIIGEWSGVDINVDTASLSKSGGVRVVALQDVDVAVRHAESFAYGYKA